MWQVSPFRNALFCSFSLVSQAFHGHHSLLPSSFSELFFCLLQLETGISISCWSLSLESPHHARCVWSAMPHPACWPGALCYWQPSLGLEDAVSFQGPLEELVLISSGNASRAFKDCGQVQMTACSLYEVIGTVNVDSGNDIVCYFCSTIILC